MDMAQFGMVLCGVQWYVVMVMTCGIVGSRPSGAGTAFEQQPESFLCLESIFH